MTSTGENGSILIVDDNPQNIQILGSVLKTKNYDVAISMTGLEALDYLTHDKPDLILLDVMMPKMDGYEVCSILKKNNASKKIPVIFITAKSETEDIVKGFKAGAVDYISKPFNAEELLARVETHIELYRSREQIKQLKDMIPICANCKKIRDDDGFWQGVEHYISEHTDSSFSHGICPDCIKIVYPEIADEYFDQKKEGRYK